MFALSIHTTVSLYAMNRFTVQSDSSYRKDWKAIEKDLQNALPKSALERVQRLLAQAQKDRNSVHITKALLYKAALSAETQENGELVVVKELQEALANATQPSKALLQSALAEVYAGYYQRNRWHIQSRTATNDAKSKDFRTWDARALTDTARTLYLASLSDAATLQQCRTQDYETLLYRPATNTENLRPTLYDVLAWRAVEFLNNTANELPKPERAFALTDLRALQSAREFVSATFSAPSPSTERDHVLLTLKVYQHLLAFHLNDPNPEAFIDAEVLRLGYAREHTVHPNAKNAYKQALERLASQYAQHPACSNVLYALALAWFQEGDYKKAKQLCDNVLSKDQRSRGARNCLALNDNILAKSLTVSVERAVLPSAPFLISLSYRNIRTVYVRLYALPIPENLANAASVPSGGLNSEEDVKKLLAQKPLHTWNYELPDVSEQANDFKEHRVELPAMIPAHTREKTGGLPLGRYVVAASEREDFSLLSNAITTTIFNVSRLALLHEHLQTQYTNTSTFFVVDAVSGAPLEGVTATLYSQEYDYQRGRSVLKLEGTFKTSSNGSITSSNGSIRLPEGQTLNKQVFVELRHKGDYYCSQNSYFAYIHHYPQQRHTSTRLFTDRALYRPGQTIYFKGIVMQHDAEKPNHTTLAGVRRTVTFYDVNYQKVQELSLVTNEFGSFEGAFTAPVGKLNGTMTLQTEDGMITVQIEEYKRPKFSAEFLPVNGAFRLGETVSINGKATAYAGSVVDGARVSYRVTRRVQYPFWRERCWWMPVPLLPDQEIAHGTTTTNTKGEFTVNFDALPDLSIDPKTLPVFSYAVSADVTDINGETHSAVASVFAGYVSMTLSVSAPKVHAVQSSSTPPTIVLSAQNLNQQPLHTSGTVTIERLQPPKRYTANLLRKRLFAKPDKFALTEQEFARLFPLDVFNNEDERETWTAERTVLTSSFTTSSNGTYSIAPTALQRLPAGLYRIKATAKDVSGEVLSASAYMTVVEESSTQAAVPDAGLLVPLNTTYEPGESATFVFSTALNDAHVLYTVEYRGRIMKQEWLRLSGQRRFVIPITEEHRGNLHVHFTLLHQYRHYTAHHTITVPWSTKDLVLETATFRDKTQPGSKEEWRIVVKGKTAHRKAAELLATLYDASLDALLPPSVWWLTPWQTFAPAMQITQDGQGVHSSQLWSRQWYTLRSGASVEYERFNTDILERALGGAYSGYYRRERIMKKSAPDGKALLSRQTYEAESADGTPPAPPANTAAQSAQAAPQGAAPNNDASRREPDNTSRSTRTPVDMSAVKARTNLNETAFFFPQLRTDSSGNVVLSFTMPEALTTWRFRALAHTPDLQTGMIERFTTTQKELMVLPNMPRFLREGDTIALPVKISSLSDHTLTGTAELTLLDAYSMKRVNTEFRLQTPQQPFSVQPNQSTVVVWRVVVPSNIDAVVYRVLATASSATKSATKSGAAVITVSDGEEAPLPVLPNRMLVTETLPFWVRGNEQRSFTFAKLAASNQSRTLSHHKLTLEVTSNPAWYAIQALPYLMEYPFECAEQTFSRLYANALASHVANSQPRIKAIFEQWKTADALLSNLEKHQDLKSALLAETPWVLDGKNESDRKKRVGLLFDLNRMAREFDAAVTKLEQLQTPNGGFAWFSGMPESRFISQYILAGIGHLKHLGVLDNIVLSSTLSRLQSLSERLVRYCDHAMNEDYQELKRTSTFNKTNRYIHSLAVQYLYARSYFTGSEIPLEYNEAYMFWLEQAKSHWQQQPLMAQGMIVLALNAFDQRGSVRETIVQSFRERAMHSEELGMYWKDYDQRSWWWYNAPIETQALMIEVFDRVARDAQAVEELKIWLLKHKQTQDWNTTKATAEACYALLLKGTDLLASDKLVAVKLGDKLVTPKKPDGTGVGASVERTTEAGTGHYTVSWTHNDIVPSMGTITLTKSDAGIAWGGLYWQYYEQLNRITPSATPLALDKKLYRQTTTEQGIVLEPITTTTPLRVGDVLKVRVELRTDRDMEYIHLKDMRGAGLEPLATISGYRWQSGLGYYQTMKDASANFFIGWLPKGVYVFEYELRATHAGTFSNGITTVQCMYAPDFASHSEGLTVRIKP